MSEAFGVVVGDDKEIFDSLWYLGCRNKFLFAFKFELKFSKDP